MLNYDFRYVLTKFGRVFRLDGWKPVREIVDGYWSAPRSIDQSEILNAIQIDESYAESFAIENDSEFLENTYPTIKLIDQLLYGLSITLYAYFEETTKEDFKPKKQTKQYMFKSCLAFSIYVIDRYLQSLSYFEYKEKRLIDLLKYGTPMYFNSFFKTHDNEEEISVYIWDLYLTYAKVGDSNIPSDYDLRDIIHDVRIQEDIAKKSGPIHKAFNYLNRTIFSYLDGNYSYPRIGENRPFEGHGFTKTIAYNEVYFSSIPLLGIVSDILNVIKTKIEKELKP